MSFFPTEKWILDKWVCNSVTIDKNNTSSISLILISFVFDYLLVVAFDMGQAFLEAAGLFLH